MSPKSGGGNEKAINPHLPTDSGGGIRSERQDREGFARGGKEGARLLRECQALLDFAVGCYGSFGRADNLRVCFEFRGGDDPDMDVDDGDDGVDGDGDDRGVQDRGSSENADNEKTKPATPIAFVNTKDTAKSVPTKTATNVTLFAKKMILSNPQLGSPAFSPTPSSHLLSDKSLCLLTQLPSSIMLLLQLFRTNQKFVKNNVGALMPGMMEFLKAVPSRFPVMGKHGAFEASSTSAAGVTSPKALSTPGRGGGATPGTTPGATHMQGAMPHTPSLSTPKVTLPSGGAIGGCAKEEEEGKQGPTLLETPGPIRTPQGALPLTTPLSSPMPTELQQRRYHCLQASHLLSAQIRTLGFITSYLIHACEEQMKAFEGELAMCVLQLLRNWYVVPPPYKGATVEYTQVFTLAGGALT